MSTLSELRSKMKAQTQLISEQEHTINSLRAENILLRAKLTARQRKKQCQQSQGDTRGR
jgi:hypothetical protein